MWEAISDYYHELCTNLHQFIGPFVVYLDVATIINYAFTMHIWVFCLPLIVFQLLLLE